MTKVNDFNQSMNNSSALIAPTRSEIRVELPHVYLPSRREMLKAFQNVYCKIAHKVSLCSSLTLSAICMFQQHVSVVAIIALSVVAVSSSIASFFIIYKEFMKED